MFLALTGAWQNLVNSLLYIKEKKAKQRLGLDRFSKLRDIYMADRRNKSFIRRLFPRPLRKCRMVLSSELWLLSINMSTVRCLSFTMAGKPTVGAYKLVGKF